MNTAQQVGAALGLAVLTTVSTTTAALGYPTAIRRCTPESPKSTADLVAGAQPSLTHRYTTAYLAAAVTLILAAAVTAHLVKTSGLYIPIHAGGCR